MNSRHIILYIILYYLYMMLVERIIVDGVHSIYCPVRGCHVSDNLQSVVLQILAMLLNEKLKIKNNCNS